MIKAILVILCVIALVPLFLPFWLLGLISAFAVGACKGGYNAKHEFLHWVTR